ncbi:hypothetical protein F4806DRAFT_507480 [Annulohypoxylon nitens]|nr:hypothetical protein F4806DRAFT_507480 [Annulohypoxylon nitens]
MKFIFFLVALPAWAAAAAIETRQCDLTECDRRCAAAGTFGELTAGAPPLYAIAHRSSGSSFCPTAAYLGNFHTCRSAVCIDTVIVNARSVGVAGVVHKIVVTNGLSEEEGLWVSWMDLETADKTWVLYNNSGFHTSSIALPIKVSQFMSAKP